MSKIFQNLTVLYIKNSSYSNIVSEYLSNRFINLIVVDKFEDIFDSYIQNAPNLILSNIIEPVDDLIEILATIKSFSTNSKIVILSDDNIGNDTLIKLMNLGVDRYIDSSISINELENTLDLVANKIVYNLEVVDKEQLFFETLNVVEDFIILTDMNYILYINTPFLNFVNLSSLDEFNIKYPLLGGVLISYDGIEYNSSLFVDMIDTVSTVRGVGIASNSIADDLIADVSKKMTVVMQQDDNTDNCCSTFEVKIKTVYSNRFRAIIFTNIDKSIDKINYYEEIINYDDLTKVYNRKKLNSDLENSVNNAIKGLNKLSLIIFDIDNLKSVNDNYGHLVGDTVLKDIAGLVARSIRSTDNIYRYGGDEFMIIMQNCNIDNAYRTAERLRVMIESYQFNNIGKITATFGVAELSESDNVELFIKQTDDALYKGKSNDKNCVIAIK